ncbi:potential choline and nitrogen mustard permease [Phaffia rhodozyma]|uniref:Potential choline and nitrogen mustard permease n=1 Tax=Phaffia rhodozyma TaxID=264483 RepID=A0A0F7SQ47_PHARH|nr:potential choline and nitrogen mustard permease [Phaffia rhodozyma]
MDDPKNKTGVYAVRAVEVVSDAGGELERRNFGTAGLRGLACILSTCVTSGGPVLMVWGLIYAAAGAMLIALSLGEMASAYPSSRGPMEWAYNFSSPKHRRFISYCTGHLNYIGYCVILAGFGVLIGQQILTLVVLNDPSFVITQWKVFLIAEAAILAATLFNIFCMAIMPIIDIVSLYFFFFSFLAYLIVPIVCARHLNHALKTPKFVFTESINLTGYDSMNGGDFVAFMIGLSGVSTAFGGTDAVVHIAEECEHPERDVPRTMWLTVVIGFLSSFVLLISLLFAVVDMDSILGTATGVPYIQLVYNATQSFSGTVCMSLMIIIITFLAMIGMVLSTSRTAFTVARDGGLFTQTYFALISPRWNVPIRVMMVTSGLSAALACTILGSTYALYSFLNCVLLLNWLCYGICIVALLISGRKYHTSGPFRLGRVGCQIDELLYQTELGGGTTIYRDERDESY